MKFLVILFAWLLLQWLGPGFMHPRDRWLSVWYERAQRLLAMLPAQSRLLLLAVLPGIAVAALAWLVSPWLAGILLLPLDLAVLAYSLGRGDHHTELDNYLERWQRGDLEAAYQSIQTSSGDSAIRPDELGGVVDAQALHVQVRQKTLYMGLERWFAVVFWFFLLGPGLALTYRILQLLRRLPAVAGQGSAEQTPGEPTVEPQLGLQQRGWLTQWLEWLDWLPARLLGLAFALTGSFVGCFQVWRENVFSHLPVRELLVIFAERAVPTAIAGSDDLGSEHFVELAANEIRELRDLLRRSALCWLVVLALLQIL